MEWNFEENKASMVTCTYSEFEGPEGYGGKKPLQELGLKKWES